MEKIEIINIITVLICNINYILLPIIKSITEIILHPMIYLNLDEFDTRRLELLLIILLGCWFIFGNWNNFTPEEKEKMIKEAEERKAKERAERIERGEIVLSEQEEHEEFVKMLKEFIKQQG